MRTIKAAEPVAIIEIGTVDGRALTNQVYRGDGSWTVVFHVLDRVGMDAREYPTKRAAIAAARAD